MYSYTKQSVSLMLYPILLFYVNNVQQYDFYKKNAKSLQTVFS